MNGATRLKEKQKEDNFTYQIESAWKRGFQLGLAIGIAGAVIWSIFVVILLTIILKT